MNRREALLTLNVNQSSSQEEIQTAYRKMALELHPDKNKEKIAVEEFKKITEAYNFLKNNEKDASSLMSTGLDLQEENKYKEAIHCYDELIKIKPAEGDDINHLMEKYNEAMMYVDEALEINPQSTNALDLKERLIDLLKSKHDEAVNISAANLQSQDALEKALELFEDKKFEEAIPYLKKAKISSRQPVAIHVDATLGMCFRKMQKYDEAIAYCDKALSIDPENTFALNVKGSSLSDLKRYDESVISHTKLLKITPLDDFIWTGKGLALSHLSKYDEAIFCYDKALKIKPDNDEYWFNKGEALHKLSKYSESILCYEKGLEINSDPEDISDWVGLDAVKAKLSEDSSSKTAEKVEVIEKSEPLDVLKMRLAKGEITLEEFNKIKEHLV